MAEKHWVATGYVYRLGEDGAVEQDCTVT